MKILVTGAAGFIASHLVHTLIAKGHTVYGVDNMSNGKFKNIEGCFSSGNFVFLEDDFTKALGQIDYVDVVVHLAAVGSVPRSIAHPDITFDNNVNKFHQLLCSMKGFSCKRLIYASSSSVTGGGSSEILYSPKSPYALSKLVNEWYVNQFSMHYGLECTGLRFFNVYGKNQRADSPYSAVIPKILCGDPIKIHAPGTQSRDFTYVKDVCSAIETVMHTKATGIYDVGYGDSRSLYELIQVLKRLMPERKFEFEMIPARPGDVLESKSFNQPLKELGWRPLYSLEQGLNDMLYGGDEK